MALFKPFRGPRASLDTQALHDGYAYFCTDDGSFHIDYADSEGNLHRKQINAKDAETLCGMTLDEIRQSCSTFVQADWNQTDETQNDYIKNKPDILTEEDVIKLIEDNGGGGGSGSTPENLAPVATSGSFNDLIHKPSVVLSLNSEGVLCMNVIYSYDETGATAYNKEEDNETGLTIEQAASVVANNNELEVN
jgi:hypothetical protein